MKKLVIITIIAFATACGSKKAATTPTNKPDPNASGAMGGSGYGGSGMAPKPAPAGGTAADPCAM
ncbi:MAG TPA: hypothetical protein VGC41_15255 [Kofleriaceae bacterium]